jgi:hypothetical protein
VDAARQILRFSIPGSLLLLQAIACYFIFRRCQGVGFTAASAPLKENIGAVVAVLAAIPIGFVVYQAYYFSYRPLVRTGLARWGGRFVRADRGYRILSSLERSQVDALERIFDTDIDVREVYRPVDPPGRWYEQPSRRIQFWLHMLELTDEFAEIEPLPRRRKAYEERWHNNWDVLRSVLDIAGTIPGATQIKSEYTILSDIYHSLGAARTAVAWGWALVLVFALTHAGRFASEPGGSIAGVAAISLLTALLYLVLHSARRRTWKSASSSVRLGLRWLFWRYADEFIPEEARGSRRGRRSLKRDLEGPAIDQAAAENRSIRDNLRAYARRRVSDLEGLIGREGEPPFPDVVDEAPLAGRARSLSRSRLAGPVALIAGLAIGILVSLVVGGVLAVCLAAGAVASPIVFVALRRNRKARGRL